MKKEKDSFVAIAGSLGGILLVIIIMVAVLAKEFMVQIIPSVVWGFVILGVFLAFFQYKSIKK